MVRVKSINVCLIITSFIFNNIAQHDFCFNSPKLQIFGYFFVRYNKSFG